MIEWSKTPDEKITKLRITCGCGDPDELIEITCVRLDEFPEYILSVRRPKCSLWRALIDTIKDRFWVELIVEEEELEEFAHAILDLLHRNREEIKGNDG